MLHAYSGQYLSIRLSKSRKISSGIVEALSTMSCECGLSQHTMRIFNVLH